MAWEIPIYDRTLADAAYAKLHQGDTSNLKGTLNVSDLNRIEHNTKYLRDILAGYSYIVDFLYHADWTVSDLFYLTDMDRIRQNVINIVNGFTTLGTTPAISLGNYNLTVTDINDVEHVLHDINFLLENMITEFYYSGELYSGETL